MFTTRPEIRGTFGAAASTHWLASQTAMRVLELGGNAFDAAFAAGMTLQVVEPHMNGPGGDAPIIFHEAKSAATRVICGQAPFPKAATIEAYRAYGLELVPATGILAGTIPGAFDAWMTMLRDFGSMRFGELMEVPIGYAERGYPATPGLVAVIEGAAPMFRTHWTSSAEIYLPGGSAPRAGSLFRNPVLAETWKRLVAEAEAAGADRVDQIDRARKGWAEGFVAEEIDRFCRTEEVVDVTGQAQKAFLTGADMAGWRAAYEDPVSYDYHGYTVCKCGPWSQGPVLLQSLAILKGLDIAALDPVGADFVHTVVEAIKLSYADREVFYGDPDFVDVPLDRLLSDAYNDERRALIGPEASTEFRPGRIGGAGWDFDFAAACRRERPVSAAMLGFGSREAPPANDDAVRIHASDTCHLDVVDRHGNMVSATPSGGWLQSSPVIPALGFSLGSRAQMAWLDEAAPSAVGPGRRPRTTLTPSFVLRDGKPYMAFGTPGGDQQDQWQLIMLLRHIHYGMNLQEAIDAPSFHSEHFPSSFFPRQASPGQLVVEGRFGEETIDALRGRGHAVAAGDAWSEGRLTAAAVEQDGQIKAAANPRGMQGYAVGR